MPASLKSRLKVWRNALPLMVAALLVCPLSPVFAQELKQLLLTDQQVISFMAAQPDFAPLVVKLSEAAEKPDDSLKGELDAVSKKHGFANFDEYMDINDNIAFVMGGLNRKTLDFTEPVERLKKDLEEIKADKDIPDDEKKLALEDLELEIKSAALLKNRENIEVVKRHFAELLKLLPDDGGEDAEPDSDPAPTDKAPEPKAPDAQAPDAKTPDTKKEPAKP